ncbi:MAG TPA: zinc-binding dehydrogenase [Verrucomicrobiae bacterium]|nr:zinc-binding dehydrogenase [Verrucomicrobiae bacterium]
MMRAAVLYGKEDVRVEDVQPAALKAGEVRIQIQAALTCGTDLKVFRRGYHAKMIVPPAVFGHELSGVVSEVLSPRSAVKVGDRVVVANSAPCGECFHCRNQQENICDDLLFLNGAYAESIVVPARIVEKNLLQLKGQTAFKDAALVEPLACVVQGIEDVKLRTGQHVLVVGAGPIGLMFVALAKKLGCEVTVAGRRAVRLEAATKLGADHVIDIDDGNNLVTKVRDASKAHFDVVIEAVGNSAVWEASVHLVRKGGTVNFFGGCPAGTTVTLDTTLIHYSDLTLLASFHHTPRTIRRALEFIEAGVIRAEDFVNGECALSELPQLLKSMTEGNRVVKTLVRVQG